MNLDQKENIDNILTYILIKKLVTPIVKMDAYRLGLINSSGKVIKQPETDLERSALTTLDRIILKLKRLLGTRLYVLNKFLYLATLNNDMYNKLIVRGTVNQRSEIQRIKRDVDSIIG